ncbi:hypothetical protein SAMN04488082_10664 [Desulfomicrobium apsheronum]|uniref:Uncharacterized protein n=1 Tax=Desulfomicrobium apsheronum TaxID=52560 RepID=A0A1I3TRF6_9BACT|nr:hypothetical protein [Desulfomicrobium apsheronum]SFJ73190.1 hypothetical protein SAMN04488082_10664 [Desulfomicrobium apsheronum]
MNRSVRKQPRILLISAKHYLMAELICGCQARGLEHAHRMATICANMNRLFGTPA